MYIKLIEFYLGDISFMAEEVNETSVQYCSEFINGRTVILLEYFPELFLDPIIDGKVLHE